LFVCFSTLKWPAILFSVKKKIFREFKAIGLSWKIDNIAESHLPTLTVGKISSRGRCWFVFGEKK